MEGKVLKIKKKVVTIIKLVKNIAITSCQNTTNIGIKTNFTITITIDNKLDIINKVNPTVIAKKYILAKIKQVIDQITITLAIFINK